MGWGLLGKDEKRSGRLWLKKKFENPCFRQTKSAWKKKTCFSPTPEYVSLSVYVLVPLAIYEHSKKNEKHKSVLKIIQLKLIPDA